MAKGRKAFEPPEEEELPKGFEDTIREYVNMIADVHGAAAATTYQTLREGEAVFMAARAAEYPDAEEQQGHLLAVRLMLADTAD